MSRHRQNKSKKWGVTRQHLYAQLRKGNMYIKLDMRHTYEQIELHPDSGKFVTINTPRCLFTYKWLPYDVSSALGIFHRVMDSLLKAIPNTMVYLDDILVTEPTEDEHLETLELVLECLAQAGFRLKASKYSILNEEVEYLGHMVDAEGIHSSDTTLSTIHEAPAPTNISELRFYLGMVNHSGRFLPNLATVLAPTHQLLRKDTKWYWRKAQQEAFDRTEEILSSPLTVDPDMWCLSIWHRIRPCPYHGKWYRETNRVPLQKSLTGWEKLHTDR